MIGSATRWVGLSLKTSSKSWMTAMASAPLWSRLRYLWPIGTSASRTQPWAMRSWTV